MVVNYANIDEQYKKVDGLKKDDVKKLMEWNKLQPHLPQLTELHAIVFLNSCYFSNEATKTCIDNYYTIRAHVPEFFNNRNPLNEELQLCAKTILTTPLPKLTPEGYCIFYTKIIDTNPDPYNFSSSMKLFDMLASFYLQENGAMKGHILIVDLEGATLTHVLKSGLLTVKKLMYYLQDALPFRLKGFHFVNAVSFMDKILGLMKPFMKKDFNQMINVHYGNNETIFKMVPRDCLPNEINGTCGSAIDISSAYLKRIVDNVDYFLEDENMKVDESKRLGKPRNTGELFGVEGTFKSLGID